jgi:biopolymer transport protein ExbD
MATDVPLEGDWRDDDELAGPVLPHRRVRDTAELDITPMIDVVFLLLIFFLVCSTAAVQSAVELPPARHGGAVSERSAVIITIAAREGPGPARVYLGDGMQGAPLPDDEDEQAARIAEFVESGYFEGKTNVLVKAERKVRNGDVWRVESAIGRAEGVDGLYVGVLEIE